MLVMEGSVELERRKIRSCRQEIEGVGLGVKIHHLGMGKSKRGLGVDHQHF